MSRFFATGSDSDSDSSSEEEQVQRQPAAVFTVSGFNISKNFVQFFVLFVQNKIFYSSAMMKRKPNVLCVQQKRNVMKI